MPHMANLSWIILFCIFNMGTLLMFVSLKMQNMRTVSQMNIYNKNFNTKWQW